MAVPADWFATYVRNQGNSAVVAGVSDVRAICPYCEVASTFAVVSQNISKFNTAQEVRMILKCNYARCQRVLYVETAIGPNNHGNQPDDFFLMHPSRLVAPAHPSIPTAIADDWREARVALNAGAPKAAAVMFRRVLYGALLDKQCKLHPLKDGLSDLIKNERLPAIFDDWLPAIKDDGHDAAHPDRALQVSIANVGETMEYTAELLRYLYIEPFEFQQRKARNSLPVSPPAPAPSQP
jgi:hypothetical protein